MHVLMSLLKCDVCARANVFVSGVLYVHVLMSLFQVFCMCTCTEQLTFLKKTVLHSPTLTSAYFTMETRLELLMLSFEFQQLTHFIRLIRGY